MSDVVVVLESWVPGLKVVSLIELLKERCSRSLADAKSDVDDLLEGREIRCSLPDEEAALSFEREAEALGVKVGRQTSGAREGRDRPSSGLWRVSAGQEGATKEALEREGYHVLDFDGRRVTNALTFFEEVRRVLPLDPPLSGRVSWDALVDSLGSGLDGLGERHVAIRWTAVDAMASADPAAFEMAVRCLTGLAEDMASEESGLEEPLGLLIVAVSS
ncbi:MAG: barstar family protein [Acidobacteriota bacterium]